MRQIYERDKVQKWTWVHGKWNKALKLALFASLIFSLSSQTLLAKDQSSSFHEQNSSRPITLTSKELRQSSEHILQNVPEFEFIIKEASKLGVRAFLFGGTASSFLNYAKDYTLWEKGSRDYYDLNFKKEKGKFDYTLIYRPSQDLDIVVDGSEDKIRTLEHSIEAKFPYVQGEKSEWELRSLRGTYGNKTPLLGDKDFRNQHTDSHSVAMVELTTPPEGKSRIRDLRHWDKDVTPMEKDILKGQVTFYHSPNHESTSRYKSGNNPPILSVIRYFIKAFQHSLTIPEEYLKPNSEIAKIIQDFKPSEGKGYVNHWMERNVKKLFLHSVDVEYAWDVLEKVDLRQKLLQVGDKNIEETPAWWMNKEPLRSKDFGKQGKTARELGIKTVTHDTSDFHVYDVITRSRKGLPNVFISRSEASGEVAAYGDGFYTSKGKQGARHTGFSIRFEVNPEAREGRDFKADGDLISILNKRAIRVIPEEIKVPSLYDYFVLLSKGQIDKNEKGLLEKLKRKLQRVTVNISKEEQERIKDLVLLNKSNSVVMREWYSLSFSTKYPEFVEKMFAKARGNEEALEFIARYVLSKPHWKDHPHFVEKFITEFPGDNTEFPGDNKWAQKAIAEFVLSKPHWKNHPHLVEKLITAAQGNEGVLAFIANYVLSKPHWKNHPHLVEKLITADQGNGRVFFWSAKYILSKPHWKNHPHLVEKLITAAQGNGEVLREIAEYALLKSHWADHPKLVEKLITAAQGDIWVLVSIAKDILSKPHWKDPKLVEKLITAAQGNERVLQEIAWSALSKPHWKNHPHLLEKVITAAQGNGWVLAVIAEFVLSKPHWKNHPHLVEMLITAAQGNEGVLRDIAEFVLSKPHWKNHPHLVEMLITATQGYKKVLRAIKKFVLSKSHWKNHPYLVEKGITAAQGYKKVLQAIKDYVLPKLSQKSRLKLHQKCSSLLE